MEGNGGGGAPPSSTGVGGVRWVICALLFFATTINYVDRQIIGILKPELQRDLGWDEIEYSNIVVAFTVAYAISLLLVGRLIDRIGTRLGYSLSVVWWSFAAMAHALASSAFGFGLARFALGLGEGGNFPASIKTVAEWFPKRERALATGLFNSGTNVGAIVTPVLVPWIVLAWGWRAAFILTGALGFLWVVVWHTLYRRPDENPRLSPAEMAFIRSDPPDPPARSVSWGRLLTYRQTWAFALGKFMTDPFWWFYLFWVPDFLQRTYGLDLRARGLPLAAIYVLSSVGSVGGGWLPGVFLARGASLSTARKTTLFLCALCVTPIAFASRVTTLWGAVAIVSLAAAAHQGWSANLFTTASDMFPRHAVGSVVGLGGAAGAVGGMLVAKVVGYVLQWTGSYLTVFLMAAAAYLLALLVIHLLAPGLSGPALEEG
ncbi:MAG TPA: MFS transporter [Vicinamibacteria bacterium]|nr:MFS transporter [Vicinamibacteria bacterium]